MTAIICPKCGRAEVRSALLIEPPHYLRVTHYHCSCGWSHDSTPPQEIASLNQTLAEYAAERKEINDG